MLVQVVRFVSPYHLFNSVLLEKLDELRKNANLREKVIHCYEQIFKYREGKVSG